MWKREQNEKTGNLNCSDTAVGQGYHIVILENQRGAHGRAKQHKRMSAFTDMSDDVGIEHGAHRRYQNKVSATHHDGRRLRGGKVAWLRKS